MSLRIFSSTGKSSKELDVFVNAVSLLRSLCETSPTALQVFNREDVIASLLHATDVKVFNQPVVVAVCKRKDLLYIIVFHFQTLKQCDRPVIDDSKHPQ